MRFFNKNLVFVLFLFIVSCDDGFDEKAYKKNKNQKPNQVYNADDAKMKEIAEMTKSYDGGMKLIAEREVLKLKEIDAREVLQLKEIDERYKAIFRKPSSKETMNNNYEAIRNEKDTLVDDGRREKIAEAKEKYTNYTYNREGLCEELKEINKRYEKIRLKKIDKRYYKSHVVAKYAKRPSRAETMSCFYKAKQSYVEALNDEVEEINTESDERKMKYMRMDHPYFEKTDYDYSQPGFKGSTYEKHQSIY